MHNALLAKQVYVSPFWSPSGIEPMTLVQWATHSNWDAQGSLFLLQGGAGRGKKNFGRGGARAQLKSGHFWGGAGQS